MAGLSGLGAAGFGNGLLKGLEVSRQHKREDEQDARTAQAHGLQMRTGEQSYAQREELFPMQKQTMGLQLNDATRKDHISELDYNALLESMNGTEQAIEQLRGGNPMAINENNIKLMETFNLPATTLWMPTQDGKLGRFDMRDTSKPLDTYANFGEAEKTIINNARELFQTRSPTAFKKLMETQPEAVKPMWRSDNKGYLYEQNTGQVKQYREDADSRNGRGGSGGLKTADENTLNNWLEGYFGKRDAQGQFILTNEQKYLAVQAQDRAVSMLNANPNLSLSRAYLIASASIAGGLPIEKAKEMAAIEAQEQGIQAKVKSGMMGGEADNPDYASFVEQRTKQLMNVSQQEAQAEYQRMIGGGQQRQALTLPAQNQQSQAPQAMPTQGQGANMQQAQSAVRVNSKEEFDRLPAGTQFLAPDGSVRVKQ